MVGLNHEFARELLWREYPTDQRGSYFRQFWDVGGMFTAGPPSDDAARERCATSAELHRWPRGSDARRPRQPRAAPPAREEEVVLVIRGELLKKYPTAVIYAQPRAVAARRQRRDRPGAGARARRPQRRGGAEPAARQAAHAAVRGEGRPRHLLLRLRPDGRRRRGAAPARRRRPAGLVLRHQGAPGRAAVRLRHRPRPGTAIETVNDLAWTDAAPGAAHGAFVPAARLAHGRAGGPGRRRRARSRPSTARTSRSTAPATAPRGGRTSSTRRR